MKKRELLEWPPCSPPEFASPGKESRNRANVDKTILVTSQRIMSEGRDVLEVDAWHWLTGLMLRYFADVETGTFKVLLIETGDWKRLAFENALNVARGKKPNARATCYGNPYGTGGSDFGYATDEDRKRIGNYLGCSLGWWETEQERTRYLKAEDRRKERISAMMALETPDIPEDFEDWVRETAFDREYLIMEEKPKTFRYTCTACAGTFTRKKQLKGKQICQKCGTLVSVTKEKQKESRWETFYILQPCLHTPGRWMERKISARRKWNKEGSTLYLQEEIRILIGQGKRWGLCYYAMYDRDHGQYFWDHNTPSYRCGKGYLYPGTLDEVKQCWDDSLKHMGLEILAERREKVNVNQAIIRENPAWEYMIKNGFTALVLEDINNSQRSMAGEMDRNGTDACSVLRLDKSRVDRLKAMNGGHVALGWLQYEKTIGAKLSQENLSWLEKHGVSKSEALNWKCLSYVRSPERFVNYLKKQSRLLGMGPNAVIGEWADYLNMAERQGLNLTADIFAKPKNLKAAHDDCVRNGQKREREKRRQEVLEKFPQTEKILESIREKYEYQEPEFSVVVPENILDIIHEGRALGHCIDTTDRYFERIENRVSFLVFLRHTSEKNVPWYTLEIEPGGTIRQERTTGNRQDKADKKAYMPFIRRWQQEIRNRMSEEDRQLAAMSEQVRLKEYKELREKKETVWHGPMAGKLLADVLEADLIEAVSM